MYGKKQVTLIWPSVTRWTTHDQACKNLCDGFKQIVSALATCTNKRKEADALGIFVEITLLKFLATSLMLYDTFVGVQPLSLVLQKSGESLVLADIPVYLDKTMSFLEKLKSANKRPFFTKPKFQQINWFFQRSNGITSTKFLHSVKPAIIWMRTIWNKCLHAIPWWSWGSVFTAWFLDGIQHIKSKSIARRAWFAWWIWCVRAWQTPLSLWWWQIHVINHGDSRWFEPSSCSSWVE